MIEGDNRKLLLIKGLKGKERKSAIIKRRLKKNLQLICFLKNKNMEESEFVYF